MGNRKETHKRIILSSGEFCRVRRIFSGHYILILKPNTTLKQKTHSTPTGHLGKNTEQCGEKQQTPKDMAQNRRSGPLTFSIKEKEHTLRTIKSRQPSSCVCLVFPVLFLKACVPSCVPVCLIWIACPALMCLICVLFSFCI